MKEALSSNTARFWLMLLGVAFGFICFVLAVQSLAHVEVPLVNEFFNLLGLGGGAQTTRNIAADHVVPAWQQNAQAASAPPYQAPSVPGNLADPPR